MTPAATPAGLQPPVLTAIGDNAVRVAFGDRIDDDIFARVRALDRALELAPPPGLAFVIPAYASVTVAFDPLATDHQAVLAHLESLLPAVARAATEAAMAGQAFTVPICYDREFSPDLDAVAAAKGISREAAIAAHLAGNYRVYMFGFAPGYAYLGGVPPEIQVPRKPAPVRGIPKGRVIIAGPQCIIQTQTMPTGWWVIGHSPFRVFDARSNEPFTFAIGDSVRFQRIDRGELDRLERQ